MILLRFSWQAPAKDLIYDDNDWEVPAKDLIYDDNDWEAPAKDIVAYLRHIRIVTSTHAPAITQ
jgi:hypothetical protein